MAFRTKLDYSDNRQIKQRERTFTVLSGTTQFGVPFSALTSGPDLSTTAITETVSNVISTFSGNTSTTIFSFGDNRMSLANSFITPITDLNSGDTQNIPTAFIGDSSTVIDGNLVYLTYTGISYDIVVSAITEVTSGNFTGSVISNSVNIYSAGTLDYTGRTIWADVEGILETNKIIIKDGAFNNYVLTSDAYGEATWQPISGATVSGDVFTTAATLVNNTLYFDRNDLLSAYSADLTALITTISGDTYVTGGTFFPNAGAIQLITSGGITSTITGLTRNFDYTDVIFVGKHGNDSRDGKHPQDAVLTLNAASQLLTAYTSPVLVYIVDAKTYTLNTKLTLLNDFLYAPYATIQTDVGGILEIGGNSTIDINKYYRNTDNPKINVYADGTMNIKIKDFIGRTDNNFYYSNPTSTPIVYLDVDRVNLTSSANGSFINVDTNGKLYLNGNEWNFSVSSSTGQTFMNFTSGNTFMKINKIETAKGGGSDLTAITIGSGATAYGDFEYLSSDIPWDVDGTFIFSSDIIINKLNGIGNGVIKFSDSVEGIHIPQLTELLNPNPLTDYIKVWDESTSAHTKVLINNIISTASTNTFTTGSTLVNNFLVFDRNDALSAYSADLSDIIFSGGSGYCITDLYVTNIWGCSPITVKDETIFEQTVSAITIDFGYDSGATEQRIITKESSIIKNDSLFGGTY